MTKEELEDIKDINRYLKELQKEDPEIVLILDATAEDSDWLHKRKRQEDKNDDP